MLEFVDSGLYFVPDKNNFINPLLQVGSGSVEKSTGSGSGGPKITGSDRIRILIPEKNNVFFKLSKHFALKTFKISLRLRYRAPDPVFWPKLDPHPC